MTALAFSASSAELPDRERRSISVTRKASAALPTVAVTLGEAIATAQRVGDGDVFAILFDDSRRALVLAVKVGVAAVGREPCLLSVSIDVVTGQVVRVDAFPSWLTRAKTCRQEP